MDLMGQNALTLRILNWSKMGLMGQKRSRFAHGSIFKIGPKWASWVKSAHGSLTVMFKMTIAGLLPSKWFRGKGWFRGKSRSRSAHANFTKWDPFFAKWWFRGKSRSRSLTLRSRNGVRFSQNCPNGRFGEKPRSRFAHGMAF